MSLLEVKNLCVSYGDNIVLRDVSFSVDAADSVGLVGESGSGKSQTALAILGLLSPTASITGSVRFAGSELLGASTESLNLVRARRIAMVFQDPMQALNPYARIGNQLRRILISHGLAEGDAADERVIAMLRRVGLPDAERQFAAYPHQLSGGMRQRVMIASALIAGPDLLIADEPTTALDVTVQAQILALLDELRDDTSLLLITHDLGVVAGLCERMLVLHRGRVVEQGATLAVFSSPQHDHTRALLKTASRLDGVVPPPVISGRSVLSIDKVSVTYRQSGRGELRAVREASLSLKEGETLAIVGESGSGKSSLVRGLLGLVPLNNSDFVFDGERRDMQMVFQDPVGSLNPQMRVSDIVSEPLRVHSRDLGSSERRERVVDMLAAVGLDETLLNRYPHQLSGGQAQRVAIARALMLGPRVLVCDEAVAALDGTVRNKILDLLRELQASMGLSIIFIAHDLAVVRSISHRIIVMYLGRVVEVADNAALFNSPQHPYTKALLDAVPVPDPSSSHTPTPLVGEIPSAFTPPSGCAFHSRCPEAIQQCKASVPELRSFNGREVACIRINAPLKDSA